MTKLNSGWLAVLVGLFAAAPLQAQSPARVRMATLAPKGSSFHQVLQAMGEKWRTAPQPVRLVIYTDGSMGGEADTVRRMKLGQIEASMMTAVGLGEIEPSVNALQNIPMLFRSLEEVDHVRKALQEEISRKFLDKGFVVLFYADAGWVYFFSRDKALRPEEFQKFKLFVWAGDAKTVDLWKAAGYRGVPLEPTDILTGLQTGLIDSVCSTPSYALAGQFYNPAPHMLDLKWAPLVGGMVITKKAWEGFTPGTQQALAAAAAEAGEQMKLRSREESEQSIAAMVKRGLQVHAVPEDVRAQWQRVSEAAYPAIRGSIVPADMFDRVQALVKEYREEQASQ